MSLNIRIAGLQNDNILHSTAAKVLDSEFGLELEEHMSNMMLTMHTHNGVGLAGPQIGDGRRILVVDIGSSNPEIGIPGILKMVNPVILESSDEKITTNEGCLSVPTLIVGVSRPSTVKVSYKTPLGDSITEEFSGFLATVVQHEIDHLDGITLLKRASNLKRSMYKSKINKAFKRASEKYDG